MKLALIIFGCLFGLWNSGALGGLIHNYSDISTYGAGANCTLAKNQTNGVICIAKSLFVLNYQDPKYDTPLECPPGTVCADVPEICSSTATPMCFNEKPGSNGTCNSCDPLISSPVCINKNQYSFCANGKIITSMTYSCVAPTPNCKVTLSATGNVTGICTALTTDLDCPN